MPREPLELVVVWNGAVRRPAPPAPAPRATPAELAMFRVSSEMATRGRRGGLQSAASRRKVRELERSSR